MSTEKQPKIARVTFTVTSENGTLMFTEGQVVPADIAAKYPMHLEDYEPPKAPVHNPALPQKLTKLMAEKMPKEQLVKWFHQYYPGILPAGELDVTKLVALAMEVQGD